MPRNALALLLVLTLTACAQFPYREKGLETVKANCTTEYYSKYSDGQEVDDAALDGEQGDCWKRSIEEHARYDLMFVEFDDQGWVQQSSNLPRPGNDYLDHFFAQLDRIRAKYRAAGRGISLVVYVHGWHHNAHANDGNVRSFRKLLGDVALAEGQAGTERRVVGIYVGWRGDSITWSWLNWITFWDRKNTAERVALGMVREFFSRLDHFRDRVEKQANQVTRMLVIGHSFGGLIVYHSLSGEFLRASARYRVEDDTGACPKNARSRYLTRFGDLVILANPAFEGTRYEPLMVSGQRLKCLNESQLPIVIIATSQADLATKNLFPIARYLGTLFEWAPDEEQKANVRTVGHNPRYTTHNLDLCGKDDLACASACTRKPMRADTQKQQQQQLAYTLDERKENIAQEQRLIAAIERRGFAAKEYFCGGAGQEFNLQLTTESQWHPKANPFWVVHTTGDIMDGHNDIFNPRFEAFVRQMYIRAINTSERTGRQSE